MDFSACDGLWQQLYFVVTLLSLGSLIVLVPVLWKHRKEDRGEGLEALLGFLLIFVSSEYFDPRARYIRYAVVACTFTGFGMLWLSGQESIC